MQSLVMLVASVMSPMCKVTSRSVCAIWISALFWPFSRAPRRASAAMRRARAGFTGKRPSTRACRARGACGESRSQQSSQASSASEMARYRSPSFRFQAASFINARASSLLSLRSRERFKSSSATSKASWGDTSTPLPSTAASKQLASRRRFWSSLALCLASCACCKPCSSSARSASPLSISSADKAKSARASMSLVPNSRKVFRASLRPSQISLAAPAPKEASAAETCNLALPTGSPSPASSFEANAKASARRSCPSRDFTTTRTASAAPVPPSPLALKPAAAFRPAASASA
mmetsp:Transcript_796/g.2200  ORF Transcript_796/g.2200 Transcript_796/m.2200 type:complete len:293 (-) Transcript_796:115-993(-)